MFKEPLFWPFVYSLPFLVILGAVIIFGVDVPASDSLYYTPYLHELVIHRQLSTSLLDFQLNEHKPLVPFMLNVVVAILFGWHIKIILIANVLIMGVAFMSLVRLAKKTLPRPDSLLFHFLILTFAVLFFSFVHWELWTKSVTTNLTLANAAAIWAVVLLARNSASKSYFLGAASFCITSSYSAIHGLLSWIAALPLIRTHRRLVWIVLFFVIAALYGSHYHRPTWPPDVTYGLHHPLQLIVFTWILMGSAFFPVFPSVASTVGIILSILLFGLLFWLYRQPTNIYRSMKPWLCLLAFAFLALGSVAVGRVGFGYEKALTSRYVFAGVLVCIPILALLYAYWVRQKLHAKLGMYFFAAIIVVGTLMSILFFPDFRLQNDHYRRGSTCLQVYETATNQCLGKLGHSDISGEDIRNWAPLLQDLRAF